MSHRAYRWKALDWSGWEHLEVRERADGVLARAVVIGERNGVRYGATYEARLTPDWVFRSIEIRRVDGAALALRSDGRGGWFDGEDAPLRALDGCIDIDLSGSPFTNTLPIRRHRFTIGVAARFRMAWIPLDTLAPFVDEQHYTRLADGGFLYQSSDRSFERVLSVDRDGFVTSYPGLFERL